MENYSLYGFSFVSESLLLSAQGELDVSEIEYEQRQRLLELDMEVWSSIIINSRLHMG